MRLLFALVATSIVIAALTAYYLIADAAAGQAAFRRQDFGEAVRHFRNAAMHYEAFGLRSVKYRQMLARSELANDDEFGALGEYRLLLRTPEAAGEAHIVLALHDWRKSNHDEALEHLASTHDCQFCRELHSKLQEHLVLVTLRRDEQDSALKEMVHPAACLSVDSAAVLVSTASLGLIAGPLKRLGIWIAKSRLATERLEHEVAEKAKSEAGCREFADLFELTKDGWWHWIAGWLPHFPISGAVTSTIVAITHFNDLRGHAQTWSCAYESERASTIRIQERGQAAWESFVQQVKSGALADEGIASLKTVSDSALKDNSTVRLAVCP